MKYFLDSAKINEIREAYDTFVLMVLQQTQTTSCCPVSHSRKF